MKVSDFLCRNYSLGRDKSINNQNCGVKQEISSRTSSAKKIEYNNSEFGSIFENLNNPRTKPPSVSTTKQTIKKPKKSTTFREDKKKDQEVENFSNSNSKIHTQTVVHNYGDFDSGSEDIAVFFDKYHVKTWQDCEEKGKDFVLSNLNLDLRSNSSTSSRNKKSNLQSDSTASSFMPPLSVYPLSAIVQFQQCDAVTQAIMQKKKYVCKFCGEIYLSGCALGGHISKVHRFVGEDYKKKINTRNEKTLERDRGRFFKNEPPKKKKVDTNNKIKRAYAKRISKN